MTERPEPTTQPLRLECVPGQGEVCVPVCSETTVSAEREGEGDR